MRITKRALTLTGAIGLAVLFAGSANAAREVTYYIVELQPWSKQACLQEVEELQNRLTGKAGEALETALAEEAEDNCEAGKLAEAQRDMNEAYRKMSQGVKGTPGQ